MKIISENYKNNIKIIDWRYISAYIYIYIYISRYIRLSLKNFWVSKILKYIKIKMQYMIKYIITIDIIFMDLQEDYSWTQ